MNEAHHTHLQEPELLLAHLNASLRDLRSAMEVLDDQKLNSEITPVMRSLLLAEVMGDLSIIAIGGSQGAGKTSLLQAIYELKGPDAEWLKPNRGQGERMPILVTEVAGCESVEAAIRCMVKQANGRYTVKDEPVDLEDFHKAVREPEPSQLLPVLKVPPRYFTMRPSHAWLLLPGYEREERQNRDWQRLMRQALIGARGCIIVTDATRLANQQQLDIAKDMLANELRGTQTVVVVSKTEGLRDRPEEQQRLRNTAREVFSIPPERGDEWILCTGTSNEDYTREWLPAFKNVAEDLALSGGGRRGMQLARLQSLLRNELTIALAPVRTRAKVFFATRDGDGTGASDAVKRCIEAFDDASVSLRKDYENALTEKLDTHLSEARKKLTECLKDGHEGIKNHLKDYFRTHSESVGRIEEDIRLSWQSAGPLLESHAQAIAEATTRRLQSRKTLALADQSNPQGGDAAAEKLPSHTILLRPNSDDIQNYQLLFRDESQGDLTREFEKSVGLLPTLTLEYARIASLAPAAAGVNDKTLEPLNQIEKPDLPGGALGNLQKGVGVGTAVLRGIATVLAVDVATDGDLDVLAVLGKIFGAGESTNTPIPDTDSQNPGAVPAAPAAAMIFGAAVIGTIAVGYLMHSAIQQVRQYDLKAAQAAHLALSGIRDRHFAHFMKHYDDSMDKMREHLKQALRQRYHLDQHLLDQDRLAKALADVRALSKDLLQHLERSGQSLALFTPVTENP